MLNYQNKFAFLKLSDADIETGAINVGVCMYV